MDHAAYSKRRNEIQVYFDRTAIDAWKRFATDAPLSRIRETVRQGRAEMRSAILECLPDNLQGWRILDAGCGAGPLSVELARRGADVTGIDLSPQMIDHANVNLPAIEGPGRVRLIAGDMLAPADGPFDAVVAMDSLIHYRKSEAVAAIATLAGFTRRSVVFTFAPSTPLLAAMHFAGGLFPRGDRAPAIEPVAYGSLCKAIEGNSAMAGWSIGQTRKVSRGFYKSQILELRQS